MLTFANFDCGATTSRKNKSLDVLVDGVLVGTVNVTGESVKMNDATREALRAYLPYSPERSTDIASLILTMISRRQYYNRSVSKILRGEDVMWTKNRKITSVAELTRHMCRSICGVDGSTIDQAFSIYHPNDNKEPLSAIYAPKHIHEWATQFFKLKDNTPTEFHDSMYAVATNVMSFLTAHNNIVTTAHNRIADLEMVRGALYARLIEPTGNHNVVPVLVDTNVA